MVPPPLEMNEEIPTVTLAEPELGRFSRGTLLAIAAGLLAVFGIAICLNPYRDDGTALPMETHRQLGLPPCTFKVMSGLPCPSCGMTTSFALLVRGDVWNSLKANAVGTLLAGFCLLLIPWSLACAITNRIVIIHSVERALFQFIVVFLILMLARWAIVLAMYFA